MNKRSVVIDFLFVFFLSLIILISSFSISYALSNNEARNRLRTYADNVSFSISNDVDFSEIETIYSNVIDLRVTVFDKEANVLLEINNDEKEAAQEDRLNELVHYSNNYYHKNSLTLGYSVLYYVLETNDNFIRVGLPRSNIESTSLTPIIFISFHNIFMKY